MKPKNLILISGLILFLGLLLSSCATLMNRTDHSVRFYSDAPDAKVQVNDSVYPLPAYIQLSRSKDNLPVKLLNDNEVKELEIKPVLTNQFLVGNLLWISGAPIGYLIDLTNEKRYYYGESVYLSSSTSDSTVKPMTYWHRRYSTEKGQINLHYSIPYVNSFYLRPKGETPKFNTGFWGTSMGLDYFYKDNKFVTLKASGVMDFFLPVIGAVDIRGEYELMSSAYFSLTDNYKLNHISLGYGLNYAWNKWSFQNNEEEDELPTRVATEKINQSIGVVLNGYYQFGKHFHTGLIYRPTFMQIKPDIKFKYEHLISLDLIWKFRLR
ncbi:MAG: hypothetical protein PHY69_03050 [Dysgonamonadaceae bacterium]|nr:hypothetical protein [Dysgonamonadaceae bacterium]